MGLFRKAFAGSWHPYTYKDTGTAELGAGVSTLALRRPQTYLRTGIAGPRYNVTGQLAVQAPAFVKQGQQLIPIDAAGTGLGYYNSLAIQPLTNGPVVKQG